MVVTKPQPLFVTAQLNDAQAMRPPVAEDRSVLNPSVCGLIIAECLFVVGMGKSLSTNSRKARRL